MPPKGNRGCLSSPTSQELLKTSNLQKVRAGQKHLRPNKVDSPLDARIHAFVLTRLSLLIQNPKDPLYTRGDIQEQKYPQGKAPKVVGHSLEEHGPSPISSTQMSCCMALFWAVSKRLTSEQGFFERTDCNEPSLTVGEKILCPLIMEKEVLQVLHIGLRVEDFSYSL